VPVLYFAKLTQEIQQKGGALHRGTELVSDTLLSLLGQLSVKLDKRNHWKYNTGCVKNFPTVLQIALGVLTHDSKALVTSTRALYELVSHAHMMQCSSLRNLLQ